MKNGVIRGEAARGTRLWVGFGCFSLAAACLQLAGCSSLANDGTNSGSNSSWTCFKKESETEPCQCQTTPVGGKQEIVDHCGPEMVQSQGAPTEAECCKDWLWLNGKAVSAYYCACYAKGSHTCNVAIGDELVDSCP